MNNKPQFKKINGVQCKKSTKESRFAAVASVPAATSAELSLWRLKPEFCFYWTVSVSFHIRGPTLTTAVHGKHLLSSCF